MHQKLLLGPDTIYEFFFYWKKKIEGYKKNCGFKNNRDHRKHGRMHEL